MIAEPWDPGPGGYQLGHFPDRWAEWNDSYRDTVRRFWRGDKDQSGDLAKRIHGSSDIFEARGRPPFSSVNLVTAHDGYSLADVVSYEHRHNEANGEGNRDGHHHNFTRNYGVEGDTDSSEILATRRRQRLNILATMFFSQGTPMLLAGDEFGHTLGGNNNAYAQDNETTWLDWEKVETDRQFLDEVRELIWLRRETSLLRLQNYIHESHGDASTNMRFEWFNRDGQSKSSHEWAHSRAFSVFVGDGNKSAMLAINGHEESSEIRLPAVRSDWRLIFSSAENDSFEKRPEVLSLEALSIAILIAD